MSVITWSYKVVKIRYSFPRSSQNRRDLPKDNPLDSVEVLRHDIKQKRSKSENKGIVPTEMELVLEQTQQEHHSDTYVFTMKMEILLVSTSNSIAIVGLCLTGLLRPCCLLGDAPVMRMASVATKPCQEYSLEFYLITGNMYTDQQGTMVFSMVATAGRGRENDYLFELLLSRDIVQICVNSLVTRANFCEMEQSFIDEYNETLELKAQLAKKKHMVENTVFNELAEVLVYVTATCHSLAKPNEKLVAVTPQNKNKKVRFGNDQIAKIMGYGDYQIRNVTISRVYYVEGLKHNLFFVDQFCDSNLEVAFKKHTCFVRNFEGVDLLKGSRGLNLYPLSIEDMMKSWLICLLSKASKTKFWLWNRCFSYLNFGTINQLAKQGLVRGLSKLKFEKDHLCSACSLEKSKKHSHKPKSEDTKQEKLSLMHMELCGLMRVESINGKKYILVIIDDYSRFTWFKFLRLKDEALEFIIKFLKMIQVHLNTTVRNICTNNGTEFVNQTLRSYYEDVRIYHETLVARTRQHNGIVKRQNCVLVQVSCTITETIHVDFDELTAMASKQSSSGPTLNHEYFNPPPSVDTLVPVVTAPEPADQIGTPSSSINQDAQSPSTSQTPQESQSLVIPTSVEE
ncbi:retrovirus-related pol polyprotein from transposon TNT 1-94 [Tanacetum coccineum]